MHDLTISYGGEPILEGASLAVGDGSFVSLVGPSGSGKSSLLRAVIGLQRPLSGTVETGLAPSQIGILFQDDALLRLSGRRQGCDEQRRQGQQWETLHPESLLTPRTAAILHVCAGLPLARRTRARPEW